MALKTYSRQRKHSRPVYEPPSKRRRISSPDTPSFSSDAPNRDNTPAEPSSPPLQPQIHDHVPDLALPSSTPPSSPPAPTRSSPSPILLKRRPTFSFLARKTTKASSTPASNKKKSAVGANSPLQPRSANDAAASSCQTKLNTTTASSTTKKQTRLTQLQLDLGTQPVQKTCATCGMAYVPSNAEDAALHKAFHAQNVGGVELGRGFVRGLAAAQRVWEGHEGDCVVVVSRRDGAAAKNRVERVMEFVKTELGAVEIGQEELWGQVEVEAAAAPASTYASSSSMAKEARRRRSAGVREAGEENHEAADAKSTVPRVSSTNTPRNTSLPPFPSPAVAVADRYKAYLYIRGTKCVGLCLAERISSAYRRGDVNRTSSSASTRPNTHILIIVSNKPPPTTDPSPLPAHLGISRIWTSSSHRRSGIASTLLSAAAQSFVYGSRVERATVAFSQPTDMGARLAACYDEDVET
ncbi:ESCO1/2 acetyl-transferase-domain-containing protein [Phyllosticta capitalensis]|uniref:ESCO1/2 acetyl-transferase-domain-containing protein n=1 Tax=Phyllosticta capitalensis TaxID=121624 RepID=UPI00312CF89E